MKRKILDGIYSAKQQDVLRYHYNHAYYMLINHGAVRTGKRLSFFILRIVAWRHLNPQKFTTDTSYKLSLPWLTPPIKTEAEGAKPLE